MSKTHKCDRCGKEFEDGDGKATCDWAVCTECIKEDAGYDADFDRNDDAVILDADRPEVRE